MGKRLIIPRTELKKVHALNNRVDTKLIQFIFENWLFEASIMPNFNYYVRDTYARKNGIYVQARIFEQEDKIMPFDTSETDAQEEATKFYINTN